MNIIRYKVHLEVVLCALLYMYLALQIFVNHISVDSVTLNKLGTYRNVCFVGKDVSIVVKALKLPYRIFDNDTYSEYCMSGRECMSRTIKYKLYILYDYANILLYVDERGVIVHKDMIAS